MMGSERRRKKGRKQGERVEGKGRRKVARKRKQVQKGVQAGRVKRRGVMEAARREKATPHSTFHETRVAATVLSES